MIILVIYYTSPLLKECKESLLLLLNSINTLHSCMLSYKNASYKTIKSNLESNLMINSHSNESTNQELTSQAQYCLHSGQFKKAESLYSQLCTIDNTNEEIWLLHAVAAAEAGMLQTALTSASRAIELDNTYVEAYLTKAHLLQRNGDLEEALQTALKAVEKDDEYTEAWLFLTGVAGQLHRYQESETWARKVIKLMPENIEAYINMANAQYEQEKFSEAEESYSFVLQKQSNHQQALLGKARILTAQKQYNESINLVEKILAPTPNNIDALTCLAANYMGMEKVDNAIETYKKIIDIDTANEAAFLSLARLYLDNNNLTESSHILLTAREQIPESVDILFALAQVYLEIGVPDSAIECYETIQDIEPDNLIARRCQALTYVEKGQFEIALEMLDELATEPEVRLTTLGAKANILERMGDYNGAYEIIKPLISEENLPASIAIAYAKLCHRNDTCDTAILLLEKALQNSSNMERDNRLLHYSLGNIYDRNKDYDAAFQHYQTANELKGYYYNYPQYRQYIDQLITFSKNTLLDNLTQSNSSLTPIFIVGMPRSGTSLVEQILASHPAVYGGGERKEITEIAHKILMLHEATKTSDDPGGNEIIQQAASYYFESLNTIVDNESFITDKMPNNYLHPALINKLFPNARIIHCTRNPFDTCLSIYFQEFSGHYDFAYNLENLANHFREYQRLMDYYINEMEIPILEVNYENMVTNTEQVTRKMLDYCGIEWDERCLQYYKNDRIVNTASYSQVREPIYTRSVGRWKNYENHIDSLKAILQP